MSTNAPTNATQAKERLYAQLASSLNNMSRAVSQTADLCEQLQIDLHALRTFAGLDAARLMTVASNLNDQILDELDEAQNNQSNTATKVDKGKAKATG